MIPGDCGRSECRFEMDEELVVSGHSSEGLSPLDLLCISRRAEMVGGGVGSKWQCSSAYTLCFGLSIRRDVESAS